MDMSLNLAFAQAKQELAACINYCLQQLKVPPFMLEIILKDFNLEVSALANKELEQAAADYQQAQASAENTNENEESVKSEN